MLINNIPWLVHQDNEVLSFNGEQREFFFQLTGFSAETSLQWPIYASS